MQSNDLGLVPQPHLGRVEDNYKPSDNMHGAMSLAKVVQVHHKSSTVDIQLLRNRGTIITGAEIEGKYSARVLTTAASHDKEIMTSSGLIEPIGLGQIVVVAFIDGTKSQPIILGSLHNTYDDDANILTEQYPLYPIDSLWKMQEATKRLYVHPSQLYSKIDGVGGVEISHPSKSFLKIDAHEAILDDAHQGFDHEDLTEKDKNSKLTISAHTEETAIPTKLLGIHRSSYDDSETTWSKIFIDESGMFRFTRDNNDGKLTYLEFAEKGEIKGRRQIDNALHGFGQDFSEVVLGEEGDISLIREKEGKTSKIVIEEKGSIGISRKNGEKLSEVKITEEGNIDMTHHSGSYIKFLDNGDIVIKPANKLHLG